MSEIITEELTGWIMDGTLDGGQRILEDEIAETFGVSRIPVREALRVLSTRGLVEIEPYVGTRVSQLSKEDIQEIYYLRTILEPIACERAVEYVTDEDIAELVVLQNILEDVCKQDNDHVTYAKTVYQYNREFHMGIYKLSRMTNLIKILDNLWHRIAFLRVRAAYSESYPAQMQNEHNTYIRLLQARDGKKLAEVLKDNLKHHLADMIDEPTKAEEGNSDKA
ncbi:GntR family transcriptional regulator [bacterium]|nr:GntR family transcriptional regulator [bacterium]